MNPGNLYHIVPWGGVTGNFLVALHELRYVDPAAYAKALAKYEGRKELLERFIPQLGCLWRETVNLSAVHPAILRGVLQECGVDAAPIRAYVINPDQLELPLLAVYDFDAKDWGAVGTYQPYSTELLLDGAEVGEATKSYFRACVAEGGKPFRFLGIRHFLYQGKIDVRKLTAVEG